MSKTLTATYGSGVTLSSASDSPTTITSTGYLEQGLRVTYDGPWQVANYGTIQGGTAGYGVYLLDGGTVTNQAGGYIGGNSAGISAKDGALTVVNAGDVTGRTGGGIYLLAGGSVTNLAGGVITGYDGVSASTAAATVINAGSIIGSGLDGPGVVITAGGTVINQAGGTIIGGSGINGEAVALTVINTGSIYGFNEFGVAFFSGGYLANQSGGTITGASEAVHAGAVFTMVNGGLIDGASEGLNLDGGGSVTNQAGGTISGGFAGIIAYNTALAVSNYGVIQGNGSSDEGINLKVGGSVTNQAGGAIHGKYEAIFASGGLTTVTNAGFITGYGTFGAGILLGGGGGVTNQADGTISGQAEGVSAYHAAVAVANNGVIAAYGSSAEAIYLTGGGSVTNQADGTITGSVGIDSQFAGATVANAGSIVGTGGTAVAFGAGYTNLLTIDPGAVFHGMVNGGNTIGATAVSTLELASGASTGTLSGLGTQFVDFGQVSIDAGAYWIVGGNETLTAGTTLTNAGTLALADSSFADNGVVINNGAIVIDPSSVTFGSLTGSGYVTIDSGSTLDVTGAVTNGETIVFSGTNNLLDVSPTAFAGQINGFIPGDTIDLTGVTDGFSPRIVNGNTLAIQRTDNPSVYLTLDPGTNYTGDQFAISGGGAITTEIPCFLRDTRIRTERGETMVQDLAVGDRVLTLSGTSRPITWIGTGRVVVSPGRRSAATPIVVRKSALADNVPYYDLRITKGHSLFVDGVLIPAEFLVNHRSIQWDDHKREVEFYHIELDAHDVLLANGSPAESYRDDGNRWLFRNANAGWDQPSMPACAPVLTGGPAVDAIWRRLLDRSGARTGVTLTDDPDLHLLVDGRRLDATLRADGAHVFSLPDTRAAVRIVSQAGAPQELGFARDPRCLGIALRRVMLRQGARVRTIDAHDPRLTDGFHAFEADNNLRWTDGDAGLPAALLEGFDGAVELVLHLGGTTRYPSFAFAGGQAAA
ncbi:Hint domain-containing protein [Acidisphaera sp. S103]|uniref:Hint domain-containing protein n=1 Tax=Acidisphaera sp. S103 TaxID=1747223 RepID=UPI00131CF570|nr:Hint domain-containing protein [Acidisphaera sp. S103]